ncbi:MAG: mannosyltransferase family protein, partial [Actinomycetota bacterium]
GAAGGGAAAGGRLHWGAALVYLAVATVLFAVVGLSVAHLPWSDNPKVIAFPGQPWLSGWVQWDSAWFHDVARNGYSYVPGEPSSAAFFPAYPLAMRLLSPATGNLLLAGIVVTVACGAASAVLFSTWARERLAPAAAATALALFLLYPFSFFLAGAVYVEALFMASILAAFLLLERGHPVWAGVAGAVATATRHVGIAVCAGLVLRALERRGGLARPPGRRWAVDVGRLRPADLGVLLSAAGIGAFAVYLWAAFGSPLTFVDAQRGWGLQDGLGTYLKFDVWDEVRDFRSPFAWAVYMSHPAMTVLAVAFLPRVFRRFGTAYGAYSVLAIVLPALALSNFFGMGRYVIPAFPCFAAAGEWLSERPRLRAPVLAVSAAGLVVTTSFFARGVYLA